MSNASDKPNGASPPVNGSVVPSKAQIIAMSELDQHRRELGRNPVIEALADSAHPLRRVRTHLTVCVGGAELSIGELLEAKEHQVLRLDRTVDQPVDVLLEGHVVARGVLVAMDDHFAVRITELPGAPRPSGEGP